MTNGANILNFKLCDLQMIKYISKHLKLETHTHVYDKIDECQNEDDL